ncbi:hypothetical protein DER29_1066 [Micromonospora sp. M71_S20]|uniref:hypothetical protein n=1 Tax=Micromonospora sp. M71_S20 TaxID=592872 RepID=UPI000F1F625A|nr:hypothetical protein [Micromonospora sp. M71_S20]RLK23211.1 hypothetical protein DER29_1066 [Micromonospora sp. M71_S20]
MLTEGTYRSRPVRLLTVLVLLVAALGVAVSRPSPAAADAAGLGGDYVSLPRGAALLDTRTGIGGRTGAVGAGGVVTFPVLGVGGVPSAGVSAVLIRLVTTDGTATTYLRAYPDGTTPNGVSMLNTSPGEQVSNTAVVRPGSNGRIAVRQDAGSSHIIITAQGYFRSTVGGGGGFVPVAPDKLIDTRDGTGTTKAKIAAQGNRTVTLTGGAIPATATAVLANVIAVNVTKPGWLGVMPAGGGAPPHSAVSFEETGHSGHLTSVPLSAAGQATFTNQSGAAVDLIVAPYGYISGDAGQGAGFRHLAATRLHDGSVAAGGTVDVQVTGKLGMPTRGVAGVVVNVTAVAPSAAGAVQVWPAGGAVPAVSQVHTRKPHSVTGLVIVPPGTDGAIRLRHTLPASTRVIVDIQGYFADPIPAAPVESFAASVGVQAGPVAGASLGMVEYAYTDNIGRVLIGHQTDVDNFGSVQWTVVSGNEAFSGRPSLGVLGDGKVQVAARYSDSDVWARTQTAVGSATWGAWADFGGSMAAAPVVTRLPSGTMAVFAVDADGKLWVYQQTGTIPAWRALSDQDFTGTPVVAPTRTGVRLFLRTASGTVATAEYVEGTLSPWTNLGGTGTSTPAVVVYPGYRTRVFVQNLDGRIATKYQDAAGTFPAAWTSLGSYVSAGAPAAVLDPVLGRTAVVTRSTTGAVMLSWETAQGSGVFGGWSAAIPDLFESAATDPTIVPVTNGAGQTWLILFRNANNASRIYERQPVAGLAAAADRSSTTAVQAGDTAVTAVARGVFAAHTLPAPPA